MDRREFHGLTLGAFASAFGGPPAAQAGSSGYARLITLSDGNLVLPLSFVLPNTPAAEWLPLLGPMAVAAGMVSPPCNLTLLRAGPRLILFDAGSGPGFQPTAGRLSVSLAAAGVEPGEITDVVFTHAHPDHLWGVVDDFDEVAFPDATFHIAAAEWEFWRSEATLDAMPEERKTFVVGARTRFDAIAERTRRFAPGAEVLPGVECFSTPGHTPGHSSFVVETDAGPVMIVGDALSNDPLSFARPDWPWGADQEPEVGAATRVRLLDRLAGEKMRLVGFHLPGNGMGRVERQGASYRFIPDA